MRVVLSSHRGYPVHIAKQEQGEDCPDPVLHGSPHRLNGTSDIVWEKVAPWLFEIFDDVQYYDYTKHEKRLRRGWKIPANYHLTFSRSEDNSDAVSRILEENRRAKVAVVFSTSRYKSLPKTWGGARVLDADKHDLRFLDKGGRIIGLRAKGDARKDYSGFVVKV